MKYVAPYGVSDPDAAYINGNPATGQQGSIPPAAAFEHPMREIEGVINKSKFTPSESDLLQLVKSIRSQRSNYAEDTGSVNTLSVSYDPPITAYTIGLLLRVKIANENDGGTTINAGAGTVAVKRSDGSDTQPGDLPTGSVIDLVFDGTAFQMVNYLGSGAGGGSITNNFQNIPYCADTSPTANIITATFSPAITSVAAGLIFAVKIANTNTGSTVINVNGNPVGNVLPNTGGLLLPADMHTGNVVLFIYDGVNYRIIPDSLLDINCTFNVPGTWASVDSVMVHLARKSISPAALVTVQLATGIYGSIKIYHANSDRILLKGTMLAAAPDVSQFAITGSSPAARAADSATNIVMLRSRFGSEIQFTGYGNSYLGIQNLGSNGCLLQDLLVTGPNAGPGLGVTTNAGADPVISQNVICTNVATWGGLHGFYGNGRMRFYNCIACGHHDWGFIAVNNGAFYGQYCISVGNTSGGFLAASQSTQIQYASTSRGNGSYGCFALDGSMVGINTSYSTTNGYMDVMSQNMSIINAHACSYNNISPYTGGANGGSWFFAD